MPPSKCKFDPLKHLVFEDIRFKDNLVLVYFKWSKTNQNSAKVSWVPICSVSDERFNVHFQLRRLFSKVAMPDKSPLFTYSVKEFHSKCSLTRLLDYCLIEAGLSLTDYSWHSFRRGAAVFAFESDLSEHAVQLLGDWSSAAFTHYLEFAFSKRYQWLNKLQSALMKV